MRTYLSDGGVGTREFTYAGVILFKAPTMRNSLLEFEFSQNINFMKRWHMRLRIAVGAFLLWITCSFVPASVFLGQTSSQQKELFTLGELSNSLEALSRRVSPAVVQILVSGYGPIRFADLDTPPVFPGSGRVGRESSSILKVISSPTLMFWKVQGKSKLCFPCPRMKGTNGGRF